jgi:hypothetical protein
MRSHIVLDNRISIVAALLFTVLAAGVSHAQQTEPGWTSPVNFDNSIQQFSITPSFAFDSNGHIHCSFTTFNNSRKVFYATNMSGSWVKSQLSTSGLSGGIGDNRVVITPEIPGVKAETVHIFINGNQSGSTHVFEYTKPVSGGSWSSPLKLTGSGWGNIGDAEVDASGGIYMIYVTIRFDPNRGELYGRYKPNGGSWGPVETIKATVNNGWPSGNTLSAKGNKFYITYFNGLHDLWLRVRDNGVLGPERTITGSAFQGLTLENPAANELACVFHVDWKDWVTFSYDGGVNWTAPMPIDTGSYFDSTVSAAYDSAGDLHVIFKKQHEEGGSTHIWYRSRRNNEWISPYRLTGYSTGFNGMDIDSIKVYNDIVHLMLVSDQQPDDFGDIAYLKKQYVANTSANPASSFTVEPGNQKVTLTWNNPNDWDHIGTQVRYSTTTTPTGPTDGQLACEVEGFKGEYFVSCDHTGLTNGTTYYYAAFTYDYVPHYGSAVTGSGTPAGPADLDRDGDVDARDHGIFQACRSGDAIAHPAGCDRSDLDDDNDVDNNDFDDFMTCWSGPNVSANPNCLP